MPAFRKFIQHLRLLLSYLFVIPLKNYKSPINGELNICLVNGRKLLNSSRANYSGGGLYDAFDQLFDELDFRNKYFGKVLILGLGAGSVVSLLREKYRCAGTITGVEVDPLIVNIAQYHFNMFRFHDLDIVCKDAWSFMEDNPRTYDLVIVDLYVDIDVPSRFLSEDFVTLLKKSAGGSGMIIFNKLGYDEPSTKEAETLTELFREVDPDIRVIRQKRNRTVNYMLVSASSENGYGKIL